jgi:hypothetical protein
MGSFEMENYILRRKPFHTYNIRNFNITLPITSANGCSATWGSFTEAVKRSPAKSKILAPSYAFSFQKILFTILQPITDYFG